ncbi:tyrosine-type recombinase/integrase [Corynebacterium hindlerae]|uniref:tyrosine-type recombinase/integrase n=1 Tax=Corynebacterium hindlerae TaxID=699041 RepID=UPI003AAAADB2
MARRKLAIGELGNINTRRIGHRKYESRARTGTITGRSREVKAWAVTAEGSRVKLKDMARKVAYVGGSAPIDAETTIYVLVQTTLDEMERVGELRPQTIRGYKKALHTLKGQYGDPNISKVQLAECTPAFVSGWIEAVADRAPSAGRNCKVVLKAAFDHAKRLGIELWAQNPAGLAKLPAAKADQAKELSDADLAGIRAAVDTWQTDRKMIPLKLMVNLLVGTGMRPGEMLALRWSDLDLEATPATLTVAGTIIEDGERKIKRQDFPKTEHGYRVLKLSGWLVSLLQEWREIATNEMVFPTRSNTWYAPNNVRRAFREALQGTKYQGWQLKNFRSAIATRIEHELGVEQAAKQLGHESPAVTNRHYVKKAMDAGDFTAVFDHLAP